MRTKDFDKWLDTILEWSDKTEKKVLDKCNWITKKVLYTTVNFSPTQPAAKYSTGYFMHNWLLSSNGTKGLSAGAATKQSKKAEIDSFLQKDYFKNNQHLYMTNTTPYAQAPRFQASPPIYPENTDKIRPRYAISISFTGLKLVSHII